MGRGNGREREGAVSRCACRDPPPEEIERNRHQHDLYRRSICAAGLGHYCASKHAVVGLTKSLALELADDDVTVNAICPGIVETPMWQELLTPSLDESYEETIDRVIPLGRDQTPEDMGKLAVFYATNRNVTGQAVAVDGGILQNVL